jgi:hypothetical protein
MDCFVDVKLAEPTGFKKVQILHYCDQGGQFVLHHDDNDGVGRVLTVIYYQNGIAGTLGFQLPIGSVQLFRKIVTKLSYLPTTASLDETVY